MIATLLTIACALGCGVLVLAELQGKPTLRIAAKLLASSSFVLLALPAWSGDRFAQLVAGGLVLGAIGDILLLGHSTRAFLGGLVAFLLGHLAYVVAIAAIEPPGRWFADAGWLVALPIAGALITLVLLWRRFGALLVPVIAYVLAITAMVIGAFAAYRAGALPDPQKTWLAVGAALFFLSDISVARERFLGRTFANKLWGLPAYFAAQLLIAWTAISS